MHVSLVTMSASVCIWTVPDKVESVYLLRIKYLINYDDWNPHTFISPDMPAVIAVSYTHLDVYKRQPKTAMAAIMPEKLL